MSKSNELQLLLSNHWIIYVCDKSNNRLQIIKPNVKLNRTTDLYVDWITRVDANLIYFPNKNTSTEIEGLYTIWETGGGNELVNTLIEGFKEHYQEDTDNFIKQFKKLYE